MRHVLDHLNERASEFGRLPLFDFLRDTSLSPRDRLAFAPYAAHFVMSFADLCSLIIRDEPTENKYQDLINRHTREDDYHWRWFLADLQTLDCNPEIAFTSALTSVWSPATVRTRMLSYRMCSLAADPDPIRRLVLVHCIEAIFKPTIEHIGLVAAEFKAQTGKMLNYLGNEHSDAESSHTIERPHVRKMVEDIVLTPAQASSLSSMVDELFGLFASFTGEMLEIAKSRQRIAAA
jgi:hypothetical protein